MLRFILLICLFSTLKPLLGNAQQEALNPKLGPWRDFIYKLPNSDNFKWKIQVKNPAVAPKKLLNSAFRLSLKNGSIIIKTENQSGLNAAVVKVLELGRLSKMGGYQWSDTTITETPAFSWRGGHLDVSRHYFTIDEVKRYIQLLALQRMNVFHWHLTDDQGWRIEIKKYPKLTSVGSQRAQTLIGHGSSKEKSYDNTPHSGFYTQAQIVEVVEFASQYGILVVPEIEMPGHAQAAIAAYPYLGVTGNEVKVWEDWGVTPNIFGPYPETLHFCKEVLDEVIKLFPSQYIHTGGDEAPKDQWKSSVRVQELMKTYGIANEEALQGWFTAEIDKHLNKKGRVLLGWDEILEGGIGPNSVVMSWRGIKGGIKASNLGHKAVMSPGSHCYFDQYQDKDRSNKPLAIGGFISVEKVYSFDPVPDSLQQKYPSLKTNILGGQANLWTEYIASERHLQYMALPRMAALGTVLWYKNQKLPYPSYKNQLLDWQEKLKLWGFNGNWID